MDVAHQNKNAERHRIVIDFKTSKTSLGRIKGMKKFQTIALVSTMALSANAMAMQALDDDTLSATTGQDGITLSVELGASGITLDKVYIHDNDGFTDASLGGTSVAGAIAINGLTITQTSTTDPLAKLVIDTDAGTLSAANTSGAFLNIGAEIAGLKIDIGAISVGESGVYDATTALRGTVGTENDIITGLSLTLGKIGANIQLGSTPQGAMIVLDTTLQGGLDIDDLGIKDAANGGGVLLDQIAVRGSGNTTGDLTIEANVNITPDGLELVSTGLQGMNTYITGVRLGDLSGGAVPTPKSIGDVEIQNLKLTGSTIKIAGH